MRKAARIAGRLPLKGRPGGGRGRRWRIAVSAGVLAVSALGALPGGALADEQPAILKSYGLDWIERIRDEAWPEPKEKRPVICMLDTGVAVTPDTPPDNLLGPIVARLSVEDPLPGSLDPPTPTKFPPGLPQGESFQHLHGTRMAAIMAAPRNDYGTVGIFPQARIVSVRVTRGTEVYISPTDVELGVRKCRTWSLIAGVRVASVVMAESLYDQRPQDVDAWEAAARLAAIPGAVLAAAVGNHPDARLVAPLAASSVVAVGAGSDSGQLCDGVPHAPGQVVAPGCSKTWPGWFAGASSATASVGALIAALATRQPTLTAEELRATFDESTVPSSGGNRVLAAGAARRHFPNLIVDPASPPPPLTPDLVVAPAFVDGEALDTPSQRVWRPGARITWRSGRLHVVRTAYRARGVLRIQLAGRAKPLLIKSQRATVRVKHRPRRAVVWAESKDLVTWRSLTRRVRVGL